jgi:hypothetical protein
MRTLRGRGSETGKSFAKKLPPARRRRVHEGTPSTTRHTEDPGGTTVSERRRKKNSRGKRAGNPPRQCSGVPTKQAQAMTEADLWRETKLSRTLRSSDRVGFWAEERGVESSWRQVASASLDWPRRIWLASDLPCVETASAGRTDEKGSWRLEGTSDRMPSGTRAEVSAPTG